MPDPDRKDLSDPGFNAAGFRTQLAGGQLRWFATILTVMSAGLFTFLLTQGEKAELDFPFPLRGRPAQWTIGIAVGVWAVIAIVNWRSWARRRGVGEP